MKKIIYSYLIVIFSISNLLGQQEHKISMEEKLSGLQTIRQEINYNFAYLDENRINWDSLYMASITKVLNSNSLLEYYSILSNLVNSFHEGHTTIRLPDSLLKYYGNINLSTFFYNNSFYVKAIGKELENKVELGAMIFKINDKNPNDYFKDCVFPRFNVPIHSSKQFLATKKLFEGLTSEVLHITFINPDGDTVSVDINRQAKLIEYNYSKNLPSLFLDTSFLYRSINDIAYLRIGSFYTDNPSVQFSKLIDSLTTKKGIIFDLRDNMGGNSTYATDIIQNFTTDSILDFWWGKNKVNNSIYRAYALYPNLHSYNEYYSDYANFCHFEGDKVQFENKTKGKLSNIPVVILCNSRTASTSESFILQLKQLIELTVVGEPSFGSITTPLIVSLPGGGSVWIGAQKALDENGNPYKFILPDIIQAPTLKDMLQGRDVALQLALDELYNN